MPNTLRRPAAATDPIIRVFEGLLATFDERLFDRNLGSVAIHCDFRKNRGIRYVPDHNEIRVGGDFAAMDLRDIFIGLIEAMIHADLRRRHLLTRSSLYYGQDFATTARGVGFYVYRTDKGWDSLRLDGARAGEKKQPDAEDRDYLVNLLDVEARSIDLEVLSLAQRHIHDNPGRTFQYKYVCGCPGPHNSVRAGRSPSSRNPLSITCNVCRQSFRLESREKPALVG